MIATGLAQRRTVLATVKDAARRFAVAAARRSLTAAARDAAEAPGLDGETPLSQTEKLSAARRGAKGEAFERFRAG